MGKVILSEKDIEIILRNKYVSKVSSTLFSVI